MYKFKIAIGDNSKDGHCQSKDFVYISNYNIPEISQAYIESCQKTKVDLEEVCSEYEDGKISEEVLEILISFGIENQKFWRQMDNYIMPKDFAELIMWFISLSMPNDFKYSLENDKVLYLNDYKGKSRQFGYGLFD